MNSTGVKASVLFPSGVWGGDYDATQERTIYKHRASYYARFNGLLYSLSKDGDGYVAVCRVES